MPSAYPFRPETRTWRGGREAVGLSTRADREKWLRNSFGVLSSGEWGRIHFTAVFVTNVTRGAPTRGRTSREKNKVPLPAASFFSFTLTRSHRHANDDDDESQPLSLFLSFSLSSEQARALLIRTNSLRCLRCNFDIMSLYYWYLDLINWRNRFYFRKWIFQVRL